MLAHLLLESFQSLFHAEFNKEVTNEFVALLLLLCSACGTSTRLTLIIHDVKLFLRLLNQSIVVTQISILFSGYTARLRVDVIGDLAQLADIFVTEIHLRGRILFLIQSARLTLAVCELILRATMVGILLIS